MLIFANDIDAIVLQMTKIRLFLYKSYEKTDILHFEHFLGKKDGEIGT